LCLPSLGLGVDRDLFVRSHNFSLGSRDTNETIPRPVLPKLGTGPNSLLAREKAVVDKSVEKEIFYINYY